MNQDSSGETEELLVSVIIPTRDRVAALLETLRALDSQTLSPRTYEIIVVDDASPDGTEAALAALPLRARLTVLQTPRDAGISRKRNLAIREARGRYVVLVSDDLLVPEQFLETHVRTLERFPGFWVVGGFQQLPSLTNTCFGRYLDRLEGSFDEARKETLLSQGIWELKIVTARNLSLPRQDLQRTGLFDEQFRDSCEDHDLGLRAREAGIRFLYNQEITCLHNDQLGDLKRFCRAQVPRTRDTVLFCAKHRSYYLEAGDSEIERANRPIGLSDGTGRIVKKVLRGFAAHRAVTPLVEAAVSAAEMARVPDAVVWKLYSSLAGLYMLRGWRLGAQAVSEQSAVKGLSR